MICVDVKEKNGEMIGFHLEGHAGYADYGQDIVCSAVSVLVINCINSIEELTDASVSLEQKEADGMIDFTVVSEVDDKVKLLFQSLRIGLRGISESYGNDYITFNESCKEVQEP